MNPMNPMTEHVSTAMNRRTFVAGAAAALGAAGSVAMGTQAAKADEAAAPFETTVDWDAEYDVIVVGFGGAGAATAITAADAGARVLLLEKAPEGYAGGNSNVCMQWVCYSENKDDMEAYFKTLRGNYDSPSDEMLDVYIDEMMKNKDWFDYLGAVNAAPFEYKEFPQFPRRRLVHAHHHQRQQRHQRPQQLRRRRRHL